MIIFADWLLSPMSQKKNKRKKLEEQKEEWKIHDIDEKEQK